MNMDMLDWTKLNPTVNKSETKKLFFSLYLFKAVVYAAGGRAIKSQASIDEYIDHRLAVCNLPVDDQYNHLYLLGI